MPKAVVLKIGGGLAIGQLTMLARAIRSLQDRGTQVLLVHGGGLSITHALEASHMTMPFVNGYRETSPEAMDVVASVLTSDINPRIVRNLQAAGVRAIAWTDETPVLSASGMEGLQRTGFVNQVHAAPLQSAMERGLVPILAPIGVDTAKRRYNINADMAAAAVAGALGAERVVFMTDVPGIYEDALLHQRLEYVTLIQLQNLRKRGSFSGGMLPKVDAISEALTKGVQHALVIDGQDAAAIQWALDTPGRTLGEGMAFGTCVTSTDHPVES